MENSVAETGLRFFGTVSASISHEIKNRMAVINEQAGLLKDLVHLAGQGREIDLQRLMRLSESMKTQVDLTDEIIRNMNRFAHSVDCFSKAVDLNDILSLAENLAKRTAGNKGVRLELRVPELSPSVVTAPFLLMNLIWLCLGAMMPFADLDHPLVMGCEKTGTGACVWFSTDRWPATGAPDMGGATSLLLKSLQAEITLDPDKKMLGIELPKSI